MDLLRGCLIVGCLTLILSFLGGLFFLVESGIVNISGFTLIILLSVIHIKNKVIFI